MTIADPTVEVAAEITSKVMRTLKPFEQTTIKIYTDQDGKRRVRVTITHDGGNGTSDDTLAALTTPEERDVIVAWWKKLHIWGGERAGF